MRAKANVLSSTAGANLDNVRAGLLPKESAANIARTGAETRQINTNTEWIDDLAKSSIDLNAANATNARAGGGYYNAQAGSLNDLRKTNIPTSFGVRQLGSFEEMARNALRFGMGRLGSGN
jgi:hypothetical protein